MAKITTDQGIIGWGLTFSTLDGKGVMEKELKPLRLSHSCPL